MNNNAPIVCASKETWPTFGDVLKVAQEQNRRKHGRVVEAYTCTVCRKFHLRGTAWARRRGIKS